MGIFDIYSNRKKNAAKIEPDVFQYDIFPDSLRIQIIQVCRDAIGPEYSREAYGTIDTPAVKYWKSIVEILRKEYGQFYLTKSAGDNNYMNEFCEWFMGEVDVDKCLDGIELISRCLLVVDEEWNEFQQYVSQKPDDALSEINQRMRAAGVGYNIVNSEIVRVDSQMLHAEVVKPALMILSQGKFSSADNEYREAHRLFRHGDYEKCLTECAKSIESVLKVISSERKWGVPETATASALYAAAFEKGLIPTVMAAEFTALRSLLTSGVPVLRNKDSAHGAGTKARKVEEHLAAFQLHQTGACLLFLAKQDQINKANKI